MLNYYSLFSVDKLETISNLEYTDNIGIVIQQTCQKLDIKLPQFCHCYLYPDGEQLVIEILGKNGCFILSFYSEKLVRSLTNDYI